MEFKADIRNFRRFFKKELIIDENWVSNGEFMIKKSVLTNKELEFVVDSKETRESQALKNLYRDLILPIENRERNSNKSIFIPKCTVGDNAITDEDATIIGIAKKYYSHFTGRGLTFYNGDYSNGYPKYNPFWLYKGDEFVGIVLGVRLTDESEFMEIA